MPSREPRCRTSGQVPSCTPATTTRSHSRPLARWAVSTATASPDGARSASVSPAISWPARLSRNSRVDPCGSRAVNLAAASNSATTASRSASASAPREPPAALSRLPLRPRGRMPSRRPTAPRAACRRGRLRGLLPAAPPPAVPLLSAGSPVPEAPAGRSDIERAPQSEARPAGLGQLARITQRLGKRLHGRRLAGRARRSRESAPQPAQPERVRTAQRPGQQVSRRLLVECLGADRAGQQSAAVAWCPAPP